jgi:sporulation protein YlmC with PRC-barrel domain
MNRLRNSVRIPAVAVLTVAVAGALGSSAFAQAPRDVERGDETRIARSDVQLQSLDQYLRTRTVRTSELIGMELQARNGDNVGEVNDVLRGTAPAQKMQLIVSIGGLAGAGDKLVAIPFDEVQINADGDEIYTNRTQDQLEAEPPVAIAARGAPVTGPADTRADPNRTGAQSADSSRSTEAGRGATASIGERRLGDLVGADVIGTGGADVGEIDDILLSTANNDALRAVLQVGGIAGIGEKRIALPFAQLEIDRSDADEPKVRVAMDSESLERQPEFKYEEHTSSL